MGLVAAKYANKIYITDDNPRNENPKNIRKIIKNIVQMDLKYLIEKAIHYAISKLDLNDTLIIAGKGHEKYQLIKNKKIDFDDFKITKNIISEL